MLMRGVYHPGARDHQAPQSLAWDGRSAGVGGYLQRLLEHMDDRDRRMLRLEKGVCDLGRYHAAAGVDDDKVLAAAKILTPVLMSQPVGDGADVELRSRIFKPSESFIYAW